MKSVIIDQEAAQTQVTSSSAEASQLKAEWKPPTLTLSAFQMRIIEREKVRKEENPWLSKQTIPTFVSLTHEICKHFSLSVRSESEVTKTVGNAHSPGEVSFLSTWLKTLTPGDSESRA